MSNNPAQLHRESVRIAVRHHLAERPSRNQGVAMVHRSISRHEQCTLEDVGDALRFLEALGQVSSQSEPLGSTLYYSITAKGILAEERS